MWIEARKLLPREHDPVLTYMHDENMGFVSCCYLARIDRKRRWILCGNVLHAKKTTDFALDTVRYWHHIPDKNQLETIRERDAMIKQQQSSDKG